MKKRKRSAGRHTVTPKRSSFGIENEKDLAAAGVILASLYSRGKMRGLSSGPAHECIFALAVDYVVSRRLDEPVGIGREDLVVKTGIPLRTIHRSINSLVSETTLVKVVSGNAGQHGALFTLERSCLPDAGRNPLGCGALNALSGALCAPHPSEERAGSGAQSKLARRMRGAIPTNNDHACVRVNPNSDSDLNDSLNQKAAEKKALLDLGYSEFDARKIASEENCTLEQIGIAIPVTKFYEQLAKRRGKPFNFLGYLRVCIIEKCPPLPTAEQRHRRRLPEHHQEKLAAADERQAAVDAQDRVMRQAVADLPDDQFAQICEEIIETEPDEIMRSMLVKMRDKARTSIVWMGKIFEAIGGAATAGGAR